MLHFYYSLLSGLVFCKIDAIIYFVFLRLFVRTGGFSMRGRALWTLIEIATPNSRCVNPAPNGLSRITRWFYTDKDIAGFEDQYDGGDRWGGWVFAGTEFSSSTGYFSDREDEGCC